MVGFDRLVVTLLQGPYEEVYSARGIELSAWVCVWLPCEVVCKNATNEDGGKREVPGGK